MDALDGNAIAGTLFEHFGAEMTSVLGTCGHCGAQSPLAELRVYLCAPGAIGRCSACGGVVMVLVRIRDVMRIDHSQLALVGAASEA